MTNKIDALRVEFDRVERDLMGEGTHCRYVRLAMHICEEASVVYDDLV